MLEKFENLPDNSRVWVYQSDREFSIDETQTISTILTDFILNWNNHGEGLKASFTIKYNLFIILSVDEDYKLASGCSIDSSVQIMKKIESLLNVNLFNRMQTAFKIDNNINLVSIAEFQKYAKAEKIDTNTIVFNNLVQTKAEFENNWETNAGNSWHVRFLTTNN